MVDHTAAMEAGHGHAGEEVADRAADHGTALGRDRGPLLDPDQAQAVNQSFDPVTNTSTIDRMHLLNRYQVTLAHNTTDEQKMTFAVPGPGYNEIQFLLFNETVPDGAVTGQERIDQSERDLHLWIKVREG